jgi:hypothetical protein
MRVYTGPVSTYITCPPTGGLSRRRRPWAPARSTKKPAPSAAVGDNASVGAQSSSWFATHSTWSGVKFPESSRISSSMLR